MKTMFKVLGIIAIAVIFVFTACDDGNRKTQIAKPALTQNQFTYNGSERTVTLNPANAAYTLGGQTSATAVGTYTATVTLTNTANYEWADGTSTALSLNWSITSAGGKTQIAKPALTQIQFTYNGNTRTVTLNSTNTAYTLSGDITKTNAGNYTATVTLTNTANYEWTDGTTDPLSLTWSISKADPFVTWPTANQITYGEALSTSTLWYGSGDGDFAWTNGTRIPTVINDGYEVTFTPNDTANYNILTRIVEIYVEKIYIPRPQLTTNGFYPDGNEHTITLTWLGLDPDDWPDAELYTLDGDTTGTDVGEYFAIVMLNDPDNYGWLPYGNDLVEIRWVIHKAHSYIGSWNQTSIYTSNFDWYIGIDSIIYVSRGYPSGTAFFTITDWGDEVDLSSFYHTTSNTGVTNPEDYPKGYKLTLTPTSPLPDGMEGWNDFYFFLHKDDENEMIGTVKLNNDYLNFRVFTRQP